MRKFPIETVLPMESLQVMGFTDVLFALPHLIRTFYTLRRRILDLAPEAVVFIDYPEFNLRLARSLKKQGYKGKLIYYICPTVWAWRKGRIRLMEKTLDLLLAIFPFEPACFSHTSLPVRYVGHPLTQAAKGKTSPETRVLALFPGSRRTEVERNFPLQLAVARKILASDPSASIAVSVAHPDLEPLLRKLAPLDRFIPPEEADSLMRSCRLALATSGTVTLELALRGTPSVVNFAIKPIDLFVAQKIFRIDLPHYCIVNIIASKTVFPEFFGPNLTEKNLWLAASRLWAEGAARDACKEGCQAVASLLGEEDASRTAAAVVSGFLTPPVLN